MAIISTSIAFYTAHREDQFYQYQYSYNFIGPLRKMLSRSEGFIHFNVAFLKSMSKPRWLNAKEWGVVVCGTQKQHYLLANSSVMQRVTANEIRLLHSHPITGSVSSRSGSNRNCDVYLRISIITPLFTDIIVTPDCNIAGEPQTLKRGQLLRRTIFDKWVNKKYMKNL
jgi:hypothetical protein